VTLLPCALVFVVAAYELSHRSRLDDCICVDLEGSPGDDSAADVQALALKLQSFERERDRELRLRRAS
jgi:hypothetical protein